MVIRVLEEEDEEEVKEFGKKKKKTISNSQFILNQLNWVSCES